MARGEGKDNARARRRPQDRQAGVTHYREALGAFQRSAYWNLRTRVANVSIAFGVIALMLVVFGGADGARLAPTLLCVLAGVCGGAVYFSRPYPALTRWLLIASITLTVVGILGLVIAVQVTG